MPFVNRDVGHAPNDLRTAFLNLVEAYYRSGGTTFPDQKVDDRWITAKALCGRLWNCIDVMPGDDVALLDLTGGATFARAARHLRAQMI